MPSKPATIARWRANLPFATLALLLVAVFLLGGGSRGDIVSLIVLRPLAVVCLALGLLTVTRAHLSESRFVCGMIAAIVALIGLHLVPLPPAIWSALPGRDLAVQASALVGLEDAWRPLTLSPHRGWNAFYAMAVPAAVVVLAIQLEAREHRRVLYLVIALACVSALLAVAQAASGMDPTFFPYRITNAGFPVGLFANRNHQAAMLCSALPLLALLASGARGPSRAVLHSAAGIIAVAFVLLVLASGSRAGLGGLGLAGLASAAFLRSHEAPVRRRGARSKRPIYIAGFLAVVALAVFLAIVFSRADAFGRVAASDVAEEYRFVVWSAVVGFIGQYMPFGSGVGSFVELFQIYEPREMLGFSYWNHVHNDWLEWALELGLPAFALLAIASIALVHRTRAIWVRLPLKKSAHQLAWGGVAILFILGLWSLVDYPLRVPSLAALAALGAVWMGAPGSAAADTPAGRSRYVSAK